MAGNGKYEVGGVLLDRPFRLRRLGHFGIYVEDPAAARRFYSDLLGFQISDVLDFAARAKPGQLAGLGETNGYFMRYAGDHHSLVLFPRRVVRALGRPAFDEIAIDQMTWQVGSLKEVVDARAWLGAHQVRLDRAGRDMPGSNWHTYFFDPDGERNELYYGMEQIGWDGRSKPRTMYKTGFDKIATLPQPAEYQEVEEAMAAGADLTAGYRHRETMPFVHEVGGIMLPRPFRITGIGPVRLLVRDLEAALSFYRDRLGFVVSEETRWRGHRCVFLRINGDHHALALYPAVIAEELSLPHHTLCLSFGVRLGDYRQLRDAVKFLKGQGVEFIHLPAELLPGMDYTAFAVGPDGELVQLYAYMEQIGWSGRPRAAAGRPVIDNAAWPESIEPEPDAFAGSSFLGPLA